MSQKMYSTVHETGLTYGEAMDKAIHEGKKVTREIWSGYWQQVTMKPLTTPTLIAVLKDGAGITTATPYAEDKVATDWMVVS